MKSSKSSLPPLAKSTPKSPLPPLTKSTPKSPLPPLAKSPLPPLTKSTPKSPLPPLTKSSLPPLAKSSLPPLTKPLTKSTPKSPLPPLAKSTLEKSYLESLPKDLVWNLMLELGSKEILNVCSSSKKLSLICKNENFWRFKLEKERADLMNFLYSLNYLKRFKIGSYRDLYIKLEKTKNKYTILPNENKVIKGDLRELLEDFTKVEEELVETIDNFLGKEVWIAYSSWEHYPSWFYQTKEKAYNALSREIDGIVENDDDMEYPSEYYIRQLKENNSVELMDGIYFSINNTIVI